MTQRRPMRQGPPGFRGVVRAVGSSLRVLKFDGMYLKKHGASMVLDMQAVPPLPTHGKEAAPWCKWYTSSHPDSGLLHKASKDSAEQTSTVIEAPG